MNGQIVAVVSSKNSAVKNVYVKLEKAGLEFVEEIKQKLNVLGLTKECIISQFMFTSPIKFCILLERLDSSIVSHKQIFKKQK